MNKYLFFLITFFCICCNNTVKETEFGKVKGTKENEVIIWYGIPYGKIPINDLRWKRPENPETWNGELDATEWKGLALQLNGDEVVGNEDCLNLDIYSKVGAKDLPVMVFLHGGNNQTGSTKEIIGTEIVKKNDIVFISVNYRLGLLGFNNLPALLDENNNTGNFTLLDISKALDWIKNNISEFGGDPKNITVSGFSAGGRDVMAMLISPLFKDKFQKAIVFSGGMTIADETLSAKKIAKAIAPLAIEDGKFEDQNIAEDWLLQSSEDVKDYLYSISSMRLAKLMVNAGIRMSVFPHLYGDDISLPKDGFDTLNYNAVPIIMITGTTEFSIFANGDSYFKSEDMKDYSNNEIEKAKEFSIKYGSKMYGYFNAEASAEKMNNSYKEIPIYLCSINYGNNSSYYKIPIFGSFHGIFVPMLSTENNYKSIGGDIFLSESYKSMSDTFNKYLKNFLYYGNPNDEDLPKWENWNLKNPLSLVLDAKNDKVIAESKKLTISYKEIIQEMNDDASISVELKNKIIKNVLNGRWFSDYMDKYYSNADLWD